MSAIWSFKKNRRIKEAKDFKQILENGKSFKSYYYKYFFRETSNQISRIGIIVSKKVGKAVKRNYEKRIIREFFRTLKLKNFDIVVVVVKKNGSFHSKKRDFLSFIDYLKT